MWKRLRHTHLYSVSVYIYIIIYMYIYTYELWTYEYLWVSVWCWRDLDSIGNSSQDCGGIRPNLRQEIQVPLRIYFLLFSFVVMSQSPVLHVFLCFSWCHIPQCFVYCLLPWRCNSIFHQYWSCFLRLVVSSRIEYRWICGEKNSQSMDLRGGHVQGYCLQRRYSSHWNRGNLIARNL